VGTHYEMLPVNRPRVPVHTNHADGPMRFDEPKSSDAYYEANSFGGPKEDKRLGEPPLKISGDAACYDPRQRHRRYPHGKRHGGSCGRMDWENAEEIAFPNQFLMANTAPIFFPPLLFSSCKPTA